MNVRVKENAWIAWLAAKKMKAGKAAIVFGKTIYLHNTGKQEFLQDEDWVCHELMHVHQYKQNGFAGFLLKYFFEWIKNGYYNNRFETEARKNEKNRVLLNDVRFI